MREAHYTACAREGQFPFLDEGIAAATWARLRRGFPLALAAIFMPDHLHLVAPGGRETRLARILGAATAQAGVAPGHLWEPVPPASPLTSLDKLRRSIRYVWLNPCRPWRTRGKTIRLVDDPLAWRWSTLRDAVGAVVDPWVAAERVGKAMGFARDRAAQILAYAVRDEYVDASARLPQAPPATDLPDGPLENVLWAALEATRAAPPALVRKTLARRIAIGLAYRQGWNFPTRLGHRLSLRPSSVCRIALRVAPADVEAAARCLDPRMRPIRPRRHLQIV